jgi:hypothetical protein
MPAQSNETQQLQNIQTTGLECCAAQRSITAAGQNKETSPADDQTRGTRTYQPNLSHT